jgi:1-acyl-sn-glycerol-3-phosphate acyltransferase
MSSVSPHPQTRSRLLHWLRLGRNDPPGPREYDPASVAGTLRRAAYVFGPNRYFPLEVAGLENVPPSPVMVVSNHSGGTSIPDVWGFCYAWYQRFGVERPIHLMAHEIILSTHITGRYFGRRGIIPANPGLGREVLGAWRRDLMVMPGGDLDTWRPYSQRYQVRFAGRTGYARLALQAGVPIVPLANAGAHESLIVLSDGQRLAHALRLPLLARANIFPVHLSLPWGLTIGPWPHLPIPVRLRYRVGKPIYPPDGLEPGAEPSPELIREHDERVRSAVQSLLDDLRRDG